MNLLLSAWTKKNRNFAAQVSRNPLSARICRMAPYGLPEEVNADKNMFFWNRHPPAKASLKIALQKWSMVVNHSGVRGNLSNESPLGRGHEPTTEPTLGGCFVDTRPARHHERILQTSRVALHRKVTFRPPKKSTCLSLSSLHASPSKNGPPSQR